MRHILLVALIFGLSPFAAGILSVVVGIIHHELLPALIPAGWKDLYPLVLISGATALVSGFLSGFVDIVLGKD